MGNFFVAMSGGATQVINATLCGIIREVRRRFPKARVFAGTPGILGALESSYVDLTALADHELRRLYRTPTACAIGITRVEILDTVQMTRLGGFFEELGVDYFLNIGGSGTIQQTKAIYDALGDRVSVAALPKTVDNDFGDAAFEDVYFTPGFPTCANYWRHKTAMMNLENLGAYTHDRIVVAQTFGRETGFIAGTARLADPERAWPLAILIPEDQQPLSVLMDHLRRLVETRQRALVVMTEGYDVGTFERRFDPSGQVMYGSSGNTSAQILVNRCMDAGITARAFVPGFDQRNESRFTSTIDLEAAWGVGTACIRWMSQGNGQFFATVARDEDALNQIVFRRLPLAELGQLGRRMPARWIREGCFDVSNEYLDYVSPLIGIGQVPVPNDDLDYYFSGAGSPLR
jgi:6-phosphofructokinase 1